MILKLIIIFLLVLLICVFINIVEGYNRYKKISFKETMDLLNVPIISFICNGVKLHFLLDTGSSYSHISPEVVSLVNGKVEPTSSIINSTGAGGTLSSQSHCVLRLDYNDHLYDSDFIITEQLSQQMDSIKKDFNIDIHGVLGGDFLNRYDYVVDFKELVAYSKKCRKIK